MGTRARARWPRHPPHRRSRSRPGTAGVRSGDSRRSRLARIRADICTTDDYRSGVCPGRQSDRDDVYMTALVSLASRGLVYGCECSRRSLAQSASSAELRYSGRCREKDIAACRRRGVAPADGPGDRDLRGRAARTAGTGSGAQCGDLLLRDRSGNWTYQFAVTVDDWRPGRSTSSFAAWICCRQRPANPARTPARPRAHAGVLPSPADYEDRPIRN